MRLILETHPDIACYDEIKGYAILQNAIADPVQAARLVGFKLPRWTEQLTRPILSDEGAEGTCKNFYRGEKILFLQRDVRDTVASMLKLKAGKANWCEMWVPRIIAAKVGSEVKFRAQYAAELSIIEACGTPLVGLAALYWKYKNDALLEYSKAGFPVLPVSYEKLVADPTSVLQSICLHLGIPFHKDLLRHNELPHTELFENGLTVGNTNPKAPIQADSVRQWDRFLSPEEVRLIELVAWGPVANVAPVFHPPTQIETVRRAGQV